MVTTKRFIGNGRLWHRELLLVVTRGWKASMRLGAEVV